MKKTILALLLVLGCSNSVLAREQIYEVQYEVCSDKGCQQGKLYSWGKPEVFLRRTNVPTPLQPSRYNIFLQSRGCFPKFSQEQQQGIYMTHAQIFAKRAEPTFKQLKIIPADPTAIRRTEESRFSIQMPGGSGICNFVPPKER